ncbi:MAG: hypothetical protein QOI95_13 [Acidimicrobiaceae bacterium]
MPAIPKAPMSIHAASADFAPVETRARFVASVI